MLHGNLLAIRLVEEYSSVMMISLLHLLFHPTAFCQKSYDQSLELHNFYHISIQALMVLYTLPIQGSRSIMQFMVADKTHDFTTCNKLCR